MFWADKIAGELKKRKLPLEWVDDMKTPSGRIHVGSLRGVVIHDLIYKSLMEIGVKTKYTYIFDDHDPMDALPVYLPKEKFEQYLGMPLFKVPSPEKGFKNYAEYYALEFKDVFNKIGCNPEILWSTDLYLSGKMNPLIKECLDKADKIRKIYEELYKKKIPKDWYPFQVYCPNCGKVSTTNVYKWNGEKVSFICEVDAVKWTKGCGAKGEISPFSNENGIVGKLPWKVEWSAKWKVLGITVEGAGKDHMSKGGSHDLASLICERVIKYTTPYPIGYEFFLVGGKKMSSSKGRGSSASEMLEILPPEILRFLMVKTKINQTIDFDPSGDTIPRLFDDYQEVGFSKEPDKKRIFELSQVTDKVKKLPKIKFMQLVQWIQAPNMQNQLAKEEAEEWIPYARRWIEVFAPEENRFIPKIEIPESSKKLSLEQKKFLAKILGELDKEWVPEDLQEKLYIWAKELNLPSHKAFAAIYLSLFGKNYGPKAGWIILDNKDFIKKRFKEVQ